MGRGSSKAGGGGSVGGAGAGGGGGVSLPSNAQNMAIMQMMGNHPQEVQDVMNVLKSVEDKYGVTINDTLVVTTSQNYLGAYTYNNNLLLNDKYFDGAKMDATYDRCVNLKYHPSRGNKSGVEAVVAHELGHRLNHVAAGNNWYNLQACADHIVMDAAKSMKMGNKLRMFRGKISGYAQKNSAECIAEAFADVFCNGSNATAESKAVVQFLDRRLTNIGVTVNP